MADERRFDEREVGSILKRVAELHESEGEAADPRSMTRAEIEHVVTELGISKALVARAVSELSVMDVRNRPVWWLGGKTDVMFEQIVDGKIDEATLNRMYEVLRRYLGDPGEIKHEGGATIWSTTAETGRRIHFTVVEQEDTTTLRLEERMPGHAGVTVVGTSFVGGFGGFMAMVPLKVFLIKSMLLLAMGPLVLIGATLGWAVGRMWWGRRAAAVEGELRAAFGEIAALAGGRSHALPPADE